MKNRLTASWFHQAGPLSSFRRPLVIAFSMVAVGSMLLLTVPLSGAQDVVSELEAEFIGRFPQFIEWPADSTVSDASVPFVIGVFGDTSLLPALQKVATRVRIKGKPVTTRSIASVAEMDTCQIVFVSKSKRGQLGEVLGRTRGKPILTIADSEGLAHRGVMINFTVDGTSIRFEINESAAEASGLRLAPKLLTLGTPI